MSNVSIQALLFYFNSAIGIGVGFVLNLVLMLTFHFSEYHLGQLKAKIAKLRTQLLEPPKVCNLMILSLG